MGWGMIRVISGTGGRSTSRQGWLQTVWDVLQADELACAALLRQAGGRLGAVELIEGETSSEEALAYARALLELGRADEAWEVFGAVVDAAFAWFRPAAVA